MPNPPKKTALLLIFLTVFIDLLGFGIVLPLIPVYTVQLGAEHGLSRPQTTLMVIMIMTSFSVMQFIFAPIWGRLSDRVGRRPILLMGLTGSTCFYALFGLTMHWGSLTGLLIARIGAGIAGATIPTAQAYIADCTPREHRARGMALIGAAFGLGFTFGPLIGALALGGSHSQAASAWPGFAASILSGCALLLAITELPESLNPESGRAARKHFDLSTLRQALAIPSLALLLLTSFLSVFTLANLESTLALTIKSLLTPAAVAAAGPSEANASISPAAGEAGEAVAVDGRQIFYVFSYIGFVQSLIQGGLVRWLAKRTSELTLAVTGTLLACAGYVLLAFVANPRWGGLAWFVVSLTVAFGGISFLGPAVQSLLSRRTPKSEQGGILGLGDSLGSLARIIGSACGLYLLRLRLGDPTLPFWTGSVVMLVIMLLIILAVRRGKDFEDSPATL
jgi:MFS family permease